MKAREDLAAELTFQVTWRQSVCEFEQRRSRGLLRKEAKIVKEAVFVGLDEPTLERVRVEAFKRQRPTRIGNERCKGRNRVPEACREFLTIRDLMQADKSVDPISNLVHCESSEGALGISIPIPARRRRALLCFTTPSRRA